MAMEAKKCLRFSASSARRQNIIHIRQTYLIFDVKSSRYCLHAAS